MSNEMCLALLLVIARTCGMLAVAPVFGDSAVPVRIRVAMGIVIALAVAGRLAVPVSAPTGAAEFLLAIGCELVIGLAIGWAARLVFVGVELAALHIAQQMGIGLAEVFDPFRDERGLLRRLFQLLAVVIFLAIGGHLDLVEALMRTFQSVPPASPVPAQGLLDLMTSMLAAGWLLGLKVAAPVLAAMLLATVAVGLLERFVPQCNTFSVGLPVRSIATLAIMTASLAALGPLVEMAWNAAAGQIAAAIQPGL